MLTYINMFGHTNGSLSCNSSNIVASPISNTSSLMDGFGAVESWHGGLSPQELIKCSYLNVSLNISMGMSLPAILFLSPFAGGENCMPGVFHPAS